MPEADSVAQLVASGLPGVVVTVEYRLAPRHRHPAALDDVVAAFRGIAAVAAARGIGRCARQPRRLAPLATELITPERGHLAIATFHIPAYSRQNPRDYRSLLGGHTGCAMKRGERMHKRFIWVRLS